MSLDKVESSNPNLKAAHAGASTRKPRHLQPDPLHAADAEGGLFCLFQTRFPFVTLQVGGKARTIFPGIVCYFFVTIAVTATPALASF